MDLAGLLITIILGIIFGLIYGAIRTILKIKKEERRAKNDFKQQEKTFQLKSSPNEKVKNLSHKMPEIQPIVQETPKERKQNLKRFRNTNKLLQKYRKAYDKGKITYEQLQKEFETRQGEAYYQKIKKEQEGMKI